MAGSRTGTVPSLSAHHPAGIGQRFRLSKKKNPEKREGYIGLVRMGGASDSVATSTRFDSVSAITMDLRVFSHGSATTIAGERTLRFVERTEDESSLLGCVSMSLPVVAGHDGTTIRHGALDDLLSLFRRHRRRVNEDVPIMDERLTVRRTNQIVFYAIVGLHE